MKLSADLENWGKGPAILEGVSVLDRDGQEWVKTRWEVESAYLPGEERPIGIPLEGAPTEVPEEGTKLLLRLYYRSASGARYRTFHRLEVGPRQSVTRLDFRQEVERS